MSLQDASRTIACGLDTAGVGGDTAAAQMVSEQVGQRPARADGQTRCTSKVVLAGHSAFHFKMLTHVIRGHTVDRGRDLLAIRIVKEDLCLRIYINCDRGDFINKNIMPLKEI